MNHERLSSFSHLHFAFAICIIDTKMSSTKYEPSRRSGLFDFLLVSRAKQRMNSKPGKLHRDQRKQCTAESCPDSQNASSYKVVLLNNNLHAPPGMQ